MKAAPVSAETKIDRCAVLILKKLAADKEPWRAELDGLLKDIKAQYLSAAPDQPIRAIGKLYYLDLTMCENQRSITSQKLAYDSLKKAMGITALVEALKFPFKLLDQHIAPEKQALFVVQARTGSRDVSATLKAIEAA